MSHFKTLVNAIVFSTLATASFADGHATNWALDTDLSNVSFGSIKNDYTGESHSFGELDGSVTADGVVTITLGLTSVETMIDIRNERMVEHVFNDQATATITAEIDMDELAALSTGSATTIETFGTLDLLGNETELDASLFVMRLGDDKVLVTTNGMLMLSTEDAGIDAGIDVLQELAGLDSITRVSPVSMRLVFNAGG